MRILVLSIEYPPVGGGASPQAHEINKRYHQLGHEVTVVTMHTGDLPLYEIIDGVEIIRVRCFRKDIHMSHLWEHIAFIYAGKRTLAKLFDQKKFDVCHTHFILPTGILSRWVKKKYRIPYIISAHGSDVPGYNPDRFQFIHKLSPRLIRSIIQEGAFIVFPSKYLRSLLQEKFTAFDDKLVHLPSGIDTANYSPGTKKPILVSTGRLLPRKGFQYLIEVVARKSYPIEVHICGDGPFMGELKAKALGSKTPIIFHGWIDNAGAKYKSLLAEASIYSLISAKENASTSLLEAMSSGCAVITSNVSGCPESVGDAGICLPPADVNALEQLLDKMVEDDAYRSHFMQAARMRAVTVFSWDSIVERYLALLTKAMKV